MTAQSLRRVGLVLVVALVALAGWQFSRHPLLAGALLLVVASVGVVQWRGRVALGRVLDAGLRCDLRALEALASRGSALGRVSAIFAAIQHGGYETATAAMCTCGQCEMDLIDRELENIRRIVRLSWGGFGVKAYELSNAQPLIDPKLPPLYRELLPAFRIVTRLVSYAAEASEVETSAARPEWFALGLEFVAKHQPAVVWPVRLAAAREAASRGDAAAVAALVEGMPAWPEGSVLETKRRELAPR